MIHMYCYNTVAFLNLFCSEINKESRVAFIVQGKDSLLLLHVSVRQFKVLHTRQKHFKGQQTERKHSKVA